MSNAAEWAQFGASVFFGIASLAMTCFLVLLYYNLFRAALRPFTSRRGNPFNPKLFFRSMLCRHRVVARSRDPYGRHFTACARCAKDINEGRPKEEWR